MNQGQKFDQQKTRWSLLPFSVVESVVKVLEYGAQKYSPENWKRVENPEDRYFSAAMRHLIAWQEGDPADPESGLSHLAHAACCVLFLLWFENNSRRKSLDVIRQFVDSVKEPEPEEESTPRRGPTGRPHDEPWDPERVCPSSGDLHIGEQGDLIDCPYCERKVVLRRNKGTGPVRIPNHYCLVDESWDKYRTAYYLKKHAEEARS
jgi:hypothetical protein